jgi:hypothetical protein
VAAAPRPGRPRRRPGAAHGAARHEVVAAGLAEVARCLSEWSSSASAAARDALADALDQHRQDLLVHLDEEERHVLALIEEQDPLPWPVKLIWKLVGERQYAKTMRKVRGARPS